MPNVVIRNQAARSPLLRKGGVHTKNESSRRQVQKNETRKQVKQWYNEGKYHER